MSDRRIADDSILIYSGVLLRNRLVPDDVTSRGTHNHVDMRRAFGDLIDIVTQHVRLCEENLCKRVFLLLRTEIKPLEGAVDIGESKEAFRTPLTQPLCGHFMSDDP